MALKKVYVGSFGPALYDDTDDIDDVDGDFSGKTQQALTTDGAADIEGDLSVGGDLDVTGDADVTGTMTVGSIKLDDTGADNTLELKWNEDGAADYVLNLLVGGGTRSLTLNENFTIGDGSAGTLTFGSACALTVELASVLNQDLTTDADVTFATVNALTLAAAAVGFTAAGGTTSKTLTVDDNFVVSTQLAAISANTDKVTESTTVTSPLVLSTYDISIPAATNAAAGHATAAHITALEANTDKVTCNFANVQTALAAASGAVDFNSQALTSVGTIGCGTITTTGNLVLPANGVIGVTDGNPQIVFDNANNWLEITADRVGIGTAIPNTPLEVMGNIQVTSATPGIIMQETDAGDQRWQFMGVGGEWRVRDLTGGTYPIRVEATTPTNTLFLASTSRIGINTAAPAAQLHVDQSSTTAAIPVLILDQADVSEEMIEFVSTIGVGNAIEAANGKTLTATHYIKVTLPGPLTRYIPVGTIA